MTLHYTRHARRQMRTRGISEVEVEAVLGSGAAPRFDAKGNAIYRAAVGLRRIKVVIDERTDPRAIITAAD